MDIKTLCTKLEARRGEWTSIAAQAGVSRRTIYRIVNGKNLPNLQTMLDLDAALSAKSKRRRESEQVAA
jgi:DNA-binding phage protein